MENQPEKAFAECENKIKRLDQDIHQLEKDLAEKNGKLNSMLVSFKDTNRIEEELFSQRRRSGWKSKHQRLNCCMFNKIL